LNLCDPKLLDTVNQTEPKHTIQNSELYQKGKENLGHLILKNMQITGGTDIDWMIERNGGFIIVECKEIHDGCITIPLGQMIAFEKLHEKLSVDGKCYFYFFATEKDTDWKNSNSSIWYFRMIQWKRDDIDRTQINAGKKRFIIRKSEMTEIPIKNFRILMESHWNEFRAPKNKKVIWKP